MSEREVMQALNSLIEAGVVEYERWRPEDSDNRTYVTRRAQKAAYDHNRKGA